MTEKSNVWSFMLSKSLLRIVDIFGNNTSTLWGNSLLPTPAPSPSFLDCWDLLQAVSCLLSWNHLWGALSKRAGPIIAGHRPTSLQTVCRDSMLTINPVCHLACVRRQFQEQCPFHIHRLIGRNMTCLYLGQTKALSTDVEKLAGKKSKEMFNFQLFFPIVA